MIDNPFAVLERKLNRLESLILELRDNPPTLPSTSQVDEFLNVESSAEFLGVVKQTIYQANAKGTLKAHKRFNKLFFRRSDLISFLEAGAVKTKKRG